MRDVLGWVLGWLLTPLVLLVPRKRLLACIAWLVFYAMLMPWAWLRKGFGRSRGWRTGAQRPGWSEMELSTKDKRLYEVPW
jgi:hypothetical protein